MMGMTKWPGASALAPLLMVGCTLGNAPCVEQGSCVESSAWIDRGCIPSALPDVPDAEGVDSNCDGVDGDAENVVFVDRAGDDSADGRRARPMRTIEAGLLRAIERGVPALVVGDGIFPEQVELVEGVAIHGGYVNEGRGFWRRDGETILRARGPVLRAVDVEATTRVERLIVQAENAGQGENSVAAHLVEADGVELVDVELVAGRGGIGMSAATPMAAAFEPDANGSPGTDAFFIASYLCGDERAVEDALPLGGAGGRSAAHPCQGGQGGSGGHRLDLRTDTANGEHSSVVFCLSYPAVLFGRAGYRSVEDSHAAGRDGQQGRDGEPGESSTGRIGARLIREGLMPGHGLPGVIGAPGTGGSGGGGGAPQGVERRTCLISGGGGGGGGAGGPGGEGGEGGEGGGWSVALLLWRSSPRLERVRLAPGSGGDGGDGASGGLGVRGGRGGEGGRGLLTEHELWMVYSDEEGNDYWDPTPITDPSDGGAGGQGGQGGQGGAGAGGSGGSSAGLLSTLGSHPVLEDVVFDSSEAAGGRGGLNPAVGSLAPAGLVVEQWRHVAPDADIAPPPTPTP